MAMPRHKGSDPAREAMRAVIRAYRALQPHEKLIVLFELGFTRADAEQAVMREMRRAAREAIEAFEAERKRERLKHRPDAAVIPMTGKADTLIVKDDGERE